MLIGKKGQTLSQLLDRLRSFYPEYFQPFFKRIYKGTEHWNDYRFAQFESASTLIAAAEVGLDSSVGLQIACSAVTQYLKYDTPLFFINKQIGEALLNTQPRTAFKWISEPLPLNAGTFILPRGLVENDEMAFVRFAFIPAGKVRIFNTNFEVNFPEPIFQITTTKPESMQVLSQVLMHQDYDYQSVIESSGYFETDRFAIQSSDSDRKLSWAALNLCVNMLLLMKARPEYVERGRRVGHHKRDRNIEFWTPHVVGAKYRAKTEAPHGSHASPRLHWRSGHFRNQGFGKFRLACSACTALPVDCLCEAGADHKFNREYEQHKVIWIEPMLVNADSENGV